MLSKELGNAKNWFLSTHCVLTAPQLLKFLTGFHHAATYASTTKLSLSVVSQPSRQQELHRCVEQTISASASTISASASNIRHNWFIPSTFSTLEGITMANLLKASEYKKRPVEDILQNSATKRQIIMPPGNDLKTRCH